MEGTIILPASELLGAIRAIIQEEISKTPTTPIEIIDREELMKRLGLTEPTIIRYEKRGKIPSIRIGTSVRYNWYSVVTSLENPKNK